MSGTTEWLMSLRMRMRSGRLTRQCATESAADWAAREPEEVLSSLAEADGGDRMAPRPHEPMARFSPKE